MRAWIECDDGGHLTELDFFVAWRGLRDLGFECRLFPALDAVELDDEEPVVGYVATVRRALERLGAPAPAPLGFPAALEPLAGRAIGRTTLGALRRATAWPTFLKPATRDKVFAGFVAERRADLARLDELPDAFELLTSEVVRFVAEHRVFVLRGRVLGCQFYKGDFRRFPDLRVADAAISAWGEAAPVGYAIDLGVTREDATRVVEVNDGFALGSYGLAPRAYARLLEARWTQLARGGRTD